jgi:hypothetical protein
MTNRVFALMLIVAVLLAAGAFTAFAPSARAQELVGPPNPDQNGDRIVCVKEVTPCPHKGKCDTLVVIIVDNNSAASPTGCPDEFLPACADIACPKPF